MHRGILFAFACVSACTILLIVALSASSAPYQEDIVPPTLVSLTFTPRSVNTADTGQMITVTLHITDELSGFKQVYLDGYAERAPQQEYSLVLTETHRISGTALDGIYQTSFTLPPYSAEGFWVARWIAVKDQLDNDGFYSNIPISGPHSYVVKLGFWNAVKEYYLPFVLSQR